jgi:hypothetical protein
VAITVGLIVSRKYRARHKVMPDMEEGIKRVGDKVVRKWAHDYREPFSDVAVFYGFDGSRDSKITQASKDYYRVAGKPFVYIDLGYFSQRFRGDRYGYHRFAVSDRHPTYYFQKFKHKSDRFDVHGIKIEPWRTPGKNIVLCGMSEKCAVFEGYDFEQWEREAIAKIKAVTDRPIIYRPKPRRSSDPSQYPPIKGVGYSDPSKRSLREDLADAWCVVSHHSNAGIDSLLAGVPCFADEGVASVLGKEDLSDIENPLIPTDQERKQFAADVAYCQFNRPEMRDGTVWRHLKNEGLVP